MSRRGMKIYNIAVMPRFFNTWEPSASSMSSIISVSNIPGPVAFTVILYGASSAAMPFVRIIAPPLAASNFTVEQIFSKI